MHSHDESLIAALAEGALEPGRAAAAEAELAGCARCSADLSAQRTALEALTALQPTALGDEERSRLRAAVAAGVGLPIADEAPSPARRPRRPVPWGAIAVAGISLAAVLAMVPLAGLLTTAGDDTGSLDAAVSTVLATEAPAGLPQPEAAGEGTTEPGRLEDRALEADEESDTFVVEMAPPADDGGDTSAATTAPTAGGVTTVEAATTTTQASSGQPVAVTLEELSALLETGALTDRVDDVRTAPCRTQASEELEGEVRALDLVVDVGDRNGIGYADADLDAVAVLSVDDCELLATLP